MTAWSKFADDEARCCAFLEFELDETGDLLELAIRARDGGEPVLRSLVAAIVAGWEGGL